MLGQLLYRVPAVHQDALFAVDKRDIRLAAAGRNEAGIVGEYPLFLVQLADIDNVGSRRSGKYRQLHFFAAGADQAKGILVHFIPRLLSARA